MAYTQFAEPNLKGKSKTSAKMDDWSYPLPFSIERELIGHTCLVARFMRLNQETN